MSRKANLWRKEKMVSFTFKAQLGFLSSHKGTLWCVGARGITIFSQNKALAQEKNKNKKEVIKIAYYLGVCQSWSETNPPVRAPSYQSPKVLSQITVHSGCARFISIWNLLARSLNKIPDGFSSHVIRNALSCCWIWSSRLCHQPVP